MDIKKITEANRKAWNQATPVHQKNRKIDLKAAFAQAGYSYLDETETAKLRDLGIEGKKVAQPGCNNGREIISIVNLGAVEGVGFDISDAAIEEARELAGIAGANCRFVRTDVYDIGAEFDSYFDLVYITIGALSWLPDLARFFAVIARLLKPGGRLAIYEQHPFMYCFATEDDAEYDKDNELRAVFSYFRTEPWVEEGGIDYIGKTRYDSAPSYCYTQKFSDIINAVARNGLTIEELCEYSHDKSNLWDYLEKYAILPLSYWLTAQKR